MAKIGKKTSSGKMLKTSTGKIGTCPSVEYSTSNCCCYLNPSPPSWSSTTTYKKNDAVFHTPPAWEPKAYPAYSGVSYNNKIWFTSVARTSTQVPGEDDYWYEIKGTWYSTINGNNLNWEPGAANAYWLPYAHCDNDDWNSISPFGGIGKTPKYYQVSIYFSYTSELYYDSARTRIWYRTTYRFKTSVTLQKLDYMDCYWSYPNCRVTQSYDWTYEEWQWTWGNGGYSSTKIRDSSGTVSIPFSALLDLVENDTIHLSSCPGTYMEDPSRGVLYWFFTDSVECYNKEFPNASFNVDVCDMAGSKSYDCFTENGQLFTRRKDCISWRPKDCEYPLWNASTIYAYNDCVAWNGKFYRSCDDNNLNREPEDDASNVCETGYYWRLA